MTTLETTTKMDPDWRLVGEFTLVKHVQSVKAVGSHAFINVDFTFDIIRGYLDNFKGGKSFVRREYG